MKKMKKMQLLLAIITLTTFFATQSCKKCDTPTPVTPVVKVNPLVGTWIGTEFYKNYTNDSLTISSSRAITLVLNEDYGGNITSFSQTIPVVWTNTATQISIVQRISTTTTTATTANLFEIKESTATTQKWFTENFFQDQAGRKTKYTYEWQLTKK
jgi:hypothetical protein